MVRTSNVSYCGLNARNIQRLKDVRRTEATEESLAKTVEKNYNNGGISYEKTISDSVSEGLKFIQDMESESVGAKFFVGTVSYGQTYGNSTDINFVVHPKFLEKLGTDETTRKEFEEDVKYLNDFSKRFKAQLLAQGQELVSQGWFCDENGNWGGWSVSKPINQSHVLQDMAEKEEEFREELKAHLGNRFKGFTMKWLEETNDETAESSEADSVSDKESTTVSGKVGVNVGKTARKIAAARTKSQLQAVIAEIRGDIEVVKAGMKKGWCDQSEMDKVNALMSMAQNRMGQVEDREPTPEEKNAFAMASLL